MNKFFLGLTAALTAETSAFRISDLDNGYPYGLVQHKAIPDGYTFNNGVLSNSIEKTHNDAETARQASVDA